MMRLDRSDLDTATGLLTVRATKFRNYGEHVIVPRKALHTRFRAGIELRRPPGRIDRGDRHQTGSPAETGVAALVVAHASGESACSWWPSAFRRSLPSRASSHWPCCEVRRRTYHVYVAADLLVWNLRGDMPPNLRLGENEIRDGARD